MSFVEVQTGKSIHAVDAEGKDEPQDEGTELDGFDAAAKGPTRVTLWVPEAHTALNMGAPVRGSSAVTVPGKPPHVERVENDSGTLVDGGFVAQSDEHIHFQTWGEKPDGTNPLAARTVVRLGTPVSVTKATGNYGTKDENQKDPTAKVTGKPPEKVEIGVAYADPYNLWDGYAMLTEGAAYHESYANHAIVSAAGDVRLCGQRAVLVGSPGDIYLMAGTADGVVDYVRNHDTSDPKDALGDSNWLLEESGWIIFDGMMTAFGIAEAALTAVVTIGAAEWFRPALPNALGWKDLGVMDVITDAAAMGGVIASVVLAIKGASAWTDRTPQQNVNVFAENDFNAYGKMGCTIHSDLSVTANGALTATLSAGLSTSVSSLVSTSISGITSSMSGIASASVTSALGSVTMTGKSSAQVSSHGPVYVASDDNAQVTSNGKRVILHGAKGFYLGCGAGDPQPHMVGGTFPSGTTETVGPGWVVMATPDAFKIGKIKGSAPDFDTIQFDDTSSLSFDDNSFGVTRGGSTFKVEDSQVTINGKRVLVG